MVMWSAMMESRSGTVVEVMRTPHWRWRSMTKTRSAPHPCVVVVVIPRIGWAIHVVVVPIRIVGNCCHNRCCSHNWGRSLDNNGSRSYRPTKDVCSPSDCLKPEHVVPAMMAERHQSKAQRKCSYRKFLVHFSFLSVRCSYLYLHYTTYLEVCKGVWETSFNSDNPISSHRTFSSPLENLTLCRG